MLSFLTAVGIALFLIMTFGPTGSYVGKNTVLSPEALESLNFRDSRIETPFKYVFDRIEYTFHQEGRAKSAVKIIGMDEYESFYLLTSSDESVDDKRVDSALFDEITASIAIYVRQEKEIKGEPSARLLQKIEVGKDGSTYRVELIGSAENPWAYFFHEGISGKIRSLFIP
ncbi:hypothetical protein [Estrella lausannensis]|nr:hypothetical protein [Estrella lausannensis]